MKWTRKALGVWTKKKDIYYQILEKHYSLSYIITIYKYLVVYLLVVVGDCHQRKLTNRKLYTPSLGIIVGDARGKYTDILIKYPYS